MTDGISGQSGNAAGSESMRLKLETPVFVAEALPQAAVAQLEVEHTSCRKELSVLRGVDGQLERFAASMMSDSEAQRAVMKGLLLGRARLEEEAVQSVLQLSNVSNLSAYVFGSKNISSAELPVAQALRSVGGSDLAVQLIERVLEHASWLEANTAQQLQSYVSFIDERTGMADGTAGAVGHAAEEGLNIFDGRQPGSVALAAEEAETDPVAALEQRVRTVVMETTSSAGGAAGVAAVLTTVLPTTLEDLMALALSGALSYVSFLNWPLKRADIKAALIEKYESIATCLDAELSAELTHSTDKLRARIHRLVAPLRRQAEVVQATVTARQSRLLELQVELEQLRAEAARL